MAQQTSGIVIAVPADIAQKILCEGYQCSRRRRVPASRNRDAALRAYQRCREKTGPAVLLEVIAVPPGVNVLTYKDGIKLETGHLPAQYFSKAIRSNSTPTLRQPTYAAGHSTNSMGYPAPRADSFRFQEPITPAVHVPQGLRQRRGAHNIEVLYHATSQSNAQSIIGMKCMRPGNHGFIGPGIYFSRTPANALRYCQCRTGSGPRVVIRCEVSVGRTLPARHPTQYFKRDLVSNACDSFEETNRDSLMIPDDNDNQINMETIRLHH